MLLEKQTLIVYIDIMMILLYHKHFIQYIIDKTNYNPNFKKLFQAITCNFTSSEIDLKNCT